MKTLSAILTDANATLDLEATLPTGDELTLRTNYANQAVFDASASIQLSEFKLEYLVGISNNITVSLPANFRELQEDPQLWDGTTWQPYPEIEVSEKYDISTSDNYSYILGNPQGGYSLILNNPLTNVTLSIIYQRYPSGFATLTDRCELSDPTFVTRKIESYVLYARGDDKFQIAEERAGASLLNMAGRESKGSGGQSQDTPMKFSNPLSS